MALVSDSDRAREIGLILHKCFTTPGVGIFGSTQMPEDLLPQGMAEGSREHVLFITLTVAIDYQRDAHQLWEASRNAFGDLTTRYLFFPEQLHTKPHAIIGRDLARHQVTRKPHRDVWIWTTVATSFLKKWNGDPRHFLAAYGYDAPTVLERLRHDSHVERGREVADYPYLRGRKIARLWLRMLRDNVGIALRRMNLIDIPVDVHIARATFSLGAIRGRARLRFHAAYPEVQKVWRQAAVGTERIALDFDEPLWYLSKFGCSTRRGNGCPRARECPVSSYCVAGRVLVSSTLVDIDT